ncbi:MAG: Fe(3+) dicitrate transport protein, partial [Flavobacteriales bacterium]
MKVSKTKPGYCPLMMKLKGFRLFILLMLPLLSFAQNKISGVVTDTNGKKLARVEIFNKSTNVKTFTDANGVFEINEKKSASFDFVFFKEGYAIVEQNSITTGSTITIVLNKVTNLTEVIIRKQNEKLFSLRKLNDIEGTAIYAGKKTEVIAINKITANKATNNARQIFAQVVGLTINESSDGGLQLSIGGRGLDPNRTSNFNTRQNGYDISADVLGYPESYYATPTEALEEIQVIRGAAS